MGARRETSPSLAPSQEDSLSPTVELKTILKRVGGKLMRFVFLGQMYFSYYMLQDLHGINLHGFPVVYIHAWIYFSVFVGLFLFMFGRPTLMDEDMVEVMAYLRWSFVNRMCDGSVYRFFCTWLHWFYPYVVVSSFACYCHINVPHSRFVLTYYALLIFIEMRNWRRIRWAAQSVTSALHLYLSWKAENPWGMAGALLMYNNLILLLTETQNPPRILSRLHVSLPMTMALSSLFSSFVVSKSIHWLSSNHDGEDRDVPFLPYEHLFLLLDK